MRIEDQIGTVELFRERLANGLEDVDQLQSRVNFAKYLAEHLAQMFRDASISVTLTDKEGGTLRIYNEPEDIELCEIETMIWEAKIELWGYSDEWLVRKP